MAPRHNVGGRLFGPLSGLHTSFTPTPAMVVYWSDAAVKYDVVAYAHAEHPFTPQILHHNTPGRGHNSCPSSVMPSLNDLVCHVQWPVTLAPFPEHRTRYGDRLVETYIAIPSHPQAFHIRLVSRKFIAEGLAVLVFIDGQYQCNRNRINLQPPKPGMPKYHTEVDFVVRQKETTLGEGQYVGREWRFDRYNLVSQTPPDVDQGHFKDLGTIEVIVLRCRRDDSEESQFSSPSSSPSSSGEDSDVLCHSADGNGRDAPQGKHTSRDRAGPSKDKGARTEPEDGLGGFFSFFDGPADDRPLYPGITADAPSDAPHRWDWQGPAGRPAPYGPQEGTHYQPYRGEPTYYDNSRRHYSYHNSPPPPPAHAHPGSVPPQSERHVRFGYGDGRGQQHESVHSRHDDRYHRDWRAENRYGGHQPTHGHYGSTHHPDSNPYADYPPQSSGHYMYDADRKTYSYGRHPEPGPAHPSYRVPSPPTGHSMPQGYAPPGFPAAQVNQMHAVPPVAPIPMIHPQSAFQATAPPYQHQPVQIQYPFPGWMPSAAPFPGAVPFYPPQNNLPLFVPYRPRFFPGPIVSSGTPDPQTNSAPDQKEQNNNAGGTGWAENTAATGGNNDAGQPADPWSSGNANDKTDSWQKNDTSNDKTDSWQNNDASNDNPDSWQNNDTSNDNWQQDHGSGWDQNDHKQDTSGTNGGNWDDSNSNQNLDSGKNQASTRGNDQSNNTNADSTLLPSLPSPVAVGKSIVRPLHGPHGTYYTSNAFAQSKLPPDVEEEPRYDVPQGIAQATGATRQVQPGKGYIYHKKRCTPEYIDSLEEPYARFVFKYRTTDSLKRLGIDVGSEPTGNEDVNTLEGLDKAELIDMLVRAKQALGGSIPGGPSKKPTPVASAPLEAAAVRAPQVRYLSSQLPPISSLSNVTGLGITFPSGANDQTSSGGGGGNANQNTNWNDTSNNWQDENNNQASGGWDQSNNANNNNNGGGWDGQQESAEQPNQEQEHSKRSSKRTHRTESEHDERSSKKSHRSEKADDTGRCSTRKSSSSSKSAAKDKPSSKTRDDKSSNKHEAAAASSDKAQSLPSRPSLKHATINFTGEGYVGGGQTDYHQSTPDYQIPSRPPTPVYDIPPRPPTPPLHGTSPAKDEKDPWNDLGGEYDPNTGW